MREHLQNTLIKNMSETGCYFLCLCEIAERISKEPVDIIKTAIRAMDNGWIEEDFTVIHPTALLESLTKEHFNVTKETSVPEGTKYYVEKWHNNRTGYSHFKLPDWDSLEDSVTVKEGFIESYRIVEIR